MTDKQEIPDIAAVTVAHNGDLRDRIAAVIQENLPWEAPNMSARLADAVIEALGLKQQDRYGFHRCVSEWAL